MASDKNNRLAFLNSNFGSRSCKRILATMLIFSIVPLLSSGFICSCKVEQGASEWSGKEAASPSQEKPSWSDGKDPEMVALVESLAGKLDEYRETLEPLESFGYRPAISGIWNGMVIVCGHLVPPPYHIEGDIEKEVVRINGIELSFKNAFSVGRCLRKLNVKRAAHERKRLHESIKEINERPDVKAKCAKKENILKYGREYFDKRIQELGVVRNEETGQPNNWEYVFRACRDTKAELERVFSADLEKVSLPETKTDGMSFHLKDPIMPPHCNGGVVVYLGQKYRDKLRYKKMYRYDDKTREEIRKHWDQEFRKQLLLFRENIKNSIKQQNIIIFGYEQPRFIDNPKEVATIRRIFTKNMGSKERLTSLLDAGIRINTSFISSDDEDYLALLVLAAEEYQEARR